MLELDCKNVGIEGIKRYRGNDDLWPAASWFRNDFQGGNNKMDHDTGLALARNYISDRLRRKTRS